MIRRLTAKDQKIVLDFVYQRERENLFVIGSFNTYKNTFEANHFFGYFHHGELIGLATSFKRWGSFVINAQSKRVIQSLTDYAIKQGIKIKQVPCFQKYGEVIAAHLKKAHRLVAKTLSRQKVLILKKKNFRDYSTHAVTLATSIDMDKIILFDRKIDGEDVNKPIQPFERARIDPKEIFILKIKGKIRSRANPHGYSKSYFQIGGVGTAEKHRGKGYAKQVVSALCRHYFNRGLKYALLFTANDNVAAQKVYKTLGFKAVDKFFIAKY